MDDSVARRGLAAQLRISSDLELVGEETVGTAGLRRLLARPPDILVIAAAEHQLTGVAMETRARELLPETSILTVSSADRNSTADISTALLADRYLPHGSGPAEIARAVRDLARSSAMGRGHARRP